MIVLDGSKSMNDEIDGGVTMWNAAVAAVTQMTSGSASMHFGLEMFSVKATSSSEKECLSGSILVPIGDGNAAKITAALPSEAQGDGTPLAAGIKVALTDPALANPDRNNSLVVITDGSESCKGDPVAAVQEAFNRPVRVRTFVVGFGGSVKAATLEKMAVSGGTARLTTPRYYQADNPADLQAALTAISNSAQNCDFSLSQTPTDLSKLHISVDGQWVSYDPSRVSGWFYDAATNRVTLYGPACDLLANTAGATVSVNYGCPDDGVDGGYFDAGQIG